ncbi:TPA: Rep protein [Bacillus cereus]|nr:Rep protein [Bacillus cereus]
MSIQAYNIKAIVSGGVYEFYRYEDTMFRGYTAKRGSGTGDTYQDEDGNPMVLDRETGELIPKQLHSRGRSNIRARNNLRRLALANFNNRSKFLTLTFKENMQDLEEANKMFKAFMRKMKKERPDLKYIAVIEFQDGDRREDGQGRGAIHYHLLCNLKYMRVEKIRKYWRDVVGEGNIDLQPIDHVDNVGAYIIEYMTKEDADPRLQGKKMYQTSQKLDKPKELIGAQAQYLYEKMLEEKRKKVYSSSYENKQTTNQVFYEEYNLKR